MENNESLTPAFPMLSQTDSQITLAGGLSKREYAAIELLQGLLSGGVYTHLEAIERAVNLADQLFMQLEKKDDATEDKGFNE